MCHNRRSSAVCVVMVIIIALVQSTYAKESSLELQDEHPLQNQNIQIIEEVWNEFYNLQDVEVLADQDVATDTSNEEIKLNESEDEETDEYYERFLQNAPTANPRAKHKIRKPSIAPTPTTPTKYPTAKPTKKPTTKKPTTKKPTTAPTKKPSPLPTKNPLSYPSSTPTRSPYTSPIITPSRTPSATPSRTPSVVPSFIGTQSPSSSPTLAPSKIPTSQPSLTISMTPSTTPSLRPSYVPSKSEPSFRDTAFANDIILIVEGPNVSPMNNTGATTLWESVTSGFVTDYLYTIDGVLDVDARVTLGEQEPPYHDHHTSADAAITLSKRFLQDTGSFSSLTLTFDVWIEYRANDESLTKSMIRELIVDAFETAASKANYIELLQNHLSENFGLYPDDSLVIKVDLIDVTSKAIQEGNNDEGGLNLSENAVIAIGCVALSIFVLSVGYYYSKPKRRIGREIELIDDGSEGDCSSLVMSKFVPSTPPVEQIMVIDKAQSNETAATKGSAPKFPVIESEIEVVRTFEGNKDDVADQETKNFVSPLSVDRNVSPVSPSTTFTFSAGFHNSSLEHFPTSASHDGSSSGYSSTRIFGAQSTVVTKAHVRPDAIEKLNNVIKKSSPEGDGLPRQPNISFNTMRDDDISFTEKLIEIDAPAGMLGIVVDSSQLGPPVIHAIKESSVLAEKLMVGDRIVYFDNVDTTELSSMQLTKLIGSKSEKATRRFGVIRRVFDDNDSASTPASWDEFSPSKKPL